MSRHGSKRPHSSSTLAPLRRDSTPKPLFAPTEVERQFHSQKHKDRFIDSYYVLKEALANVEKSEQQTAQFFPPPEEEKRTKIPRLENQKSKKVLLRAVTEDGVLAQAAMGFIITYASKESFAMSLLRRILAATWMTEFGKLIQNVWLGWTLKPPLMRASASRKEGRPAFSFTLTKCHAASSRLQ
ncbi:hypothetical protein BC829DRAFT_395069 [Chytridium lagenaria]|nr:hypothetical protein BC829DRAFT_395069 [Chytridium lagenaria]